MKKKKIKRNLWIAIFLIVVAAVFFISPSYAIFKNSASSESGITTADWIVSLEQQGIDNNVRVVPGIENGTYTLKVKSLSLVDVKYDIVISNLPSGTDVSIDGVNYPTVSNGTVTIPNAGTILYSAQEKTNTHTLTFRGASNATPVNNQEVTIDVNISQLLN